MLNQVLIWSPYSTGHHPAYVEQVIRSLAPSNIAEIVVCTPYSFRELEEGFPYLNQHLSMTNHCDIIFLSTRDFSGTLASSVYTQFIQFLLCSNHLFANRPERLIIPYADSMFLFLPLLLLIHRIVNHGASSLIWMRLQFYFPNLSINKQFAEFLKKVVIAFVGRCCSAKNYTPDILACNYLQGKNICSLSYLPERTINPLAMEVEQPYLEKSPIFKVLLFGVISERKSIPNLIRLANRFRDDLLIYAVGKHSASVMHTFELAAVPNIFSIDEYVSDAMLSVFLQGVDAVWCLQECHDLSSSAVANAISYDKILIYESGIYTTTIAKAYSKSIHYNRLIALTASQLHILKRSKPHNTSNMITDSLSHLFSSDWAGVLL